MVDFVNLANVAERLIASNGRDVTVHKHSETPIDVSKPWKGKNDATDVGLVVKAVVFPSVVLTEGGTKYSQTAYISAPAMGVEDLRTFDNLTDGSIFYNIKSVEPIAPGVTDVLFILGLEK